MALDKLPFLSAATNLYSQNTSSVNPIKTSVGERGTSQTEGTSKTQGFENRGQLWDGFSVGANNGTGELRPKIQNEILGNKLDICA